MPKLSVPALFETRVKFLVPRFFNARRRCSGTPHIPNPPTKIVAPSVTRSIATSALATRLSIRSHLWPIRMHAEKRSKHHGGSLLQVGAVVVQGFIQIVCSAKLLFEFAAGQMSAKKIDGLRCPVERTPDIVRIREANVAPHVIWTSRDPQKVPQPATSER